MTLLWNRNRPLPADCRGAWAAAVRDPARRIMERGRWLCAGAWRPIVRGHCREMWKELR